MELKKVFRESRNRVRLWIVGIFAFLTIAFMVVVSQAENVKASGNYDITTFPTNTGTIFPTGITATFENPTSTQWAPICTPILTPTNTYIFGMTPFWTNEPTVNIPTSEFPTVVWNTPAGTVTPDKTVIPGTSTLVSTSTGTGIPTGTGTTTITPTGTLEHPGEFNVGITILNGNTIVIDSGSYVRCNDISGDVVIDYTVPPEGGAVTSNYDNGFYCHGHVSGHGINGNDNFQIMTGINNLNNGYSITWNYSSTIATSCPDGRSGVFGPPWLAWSSGQFSYASPGGRGINGYQCVTAVASGSLDFTYNVSEYEIPTATPTASPVPSGTVTIQCKPPIKNGDEPPIVTWVPWTVIPGTCTIVIPAFYMPLSSIPMVGLPDIDFPGLNVCTMLVNIQMTLFGVSTIMLAQVLVVLGCGRVLIATFRSG